jgi:hypothetical protein
MDFFLWFHLISLPEKLGGLYSPFRRKVLQHVLILGRGDSQGSALVQPKATLGGRCNGNISDRFGFLKQAAR